MLNCQEMDDSLIPKTVPLPSEHITDEGIYLRENGEDCLIYVGNAVDPDILCQLLGISSVEEISSQVFSPVSWLNIFIIFKILDIVKMLSGDDFIWK